MVASILAKNNGYTIIDMNKISETVRTNLSDPEGEPFEGDVPIADVEKEIVSLIDSAQKSG